MTPMTGTIREVSVENRLERLTEIYAALESFLGDNNLPDTLRQQLFLVTEELFTNLVHYGYGEGEADLIVIAAERMETAIRLTIRDHAAAFDVSQPPKLPAPEIDLDNMEIGGLGLFLVHEFAQSVRNWRDGALNTTEILLPLPSEGPSGD
jgi:serine/threonine-protein kinase RsbW